MPPGRSMRGVASGKHAMTVDSKPTVGASPVKMQATSRFACGGQSPPPPPWFCPPTHPFFGVTWQPLHEGRAAFAFRFPFWSDSFRAVASKDLPPSQRAMCSGRVGDRRPERLAEGAAIAPPNSRSKARAVGCEGTRTAIVSKPAVASSDTGAEARRDSTKLNGPGQKRSARRRASGVASPSAKAASALSTWMMSGLKAGRPFTAKTAAMAVSEAASAPKP